MLNKLKWSIMVEVSAWIAKKMGMSPERFLEIWDEILEEQKNA